MTEHVVLGSRGMLGRAWCELLKSEDIPFRTLDRPGFDLAREDSSAELLDGAEVVINCAAWTAVDDAEAHEEAATQVNGHAVGRLATFCKKIDATLVHYSTDYVFNGRATVPYRVDTPREPINAYGRSKAVGECALEDSGASHLLLRTSWLYAPWGQNFVRTMARLTKEKSHLRVVNDQRGRPTSAVQLAKSSLGLLNAEQRGVFHVSDGGECTWFELTCFIAETLGTSCAIEPCSSEEYPRPAARPAYSVFDLTKTEDVLGPLPHWKELVADALRAESRAET